MQFYFKEIYKVSKFTKLVFIKAKGEISLILTAVTLLLDMLNQKTIK